MIGLYFNTEVGACSDLEHGKRCLIRSARAYAELKVRISGHYQEPGGASSIILVRDPSGCFHNIGSLMHVLSPPERTSVMLFLDGFAKGKTYDLSADTHQGWLLEGIRVPSPILEYAFRHNGMALSIATDGCWERDEFRFIDQDGYLPNLWGQDDLSPLMDWIRTQESPLTRLKNDYAVCICDNSLKDNTFTPDEWESILKYFCKAKATNYVADDILIKNFDIPEIGEDHLKELRIKSPAAIRIFFLFRGGIVYVGGDYRHGNGGKKAQNAAGKRARNRIIAHLNGQGSA